MPEQRLGHVRWDGFDHRHLWNMVMDARPNDVFDRYERWTKLGARLTEVNEAVQGTLNTLFGSWRGAAAGTAALGNTGVLNWAQEAAETIQRAGEQLGHYGNALVDARNRMPQPRHVYYERSFRAGDGATVLNGPENIYTLLQLADDQMYTLRERREAKQRAVEVMRVFEADAIDVSQRLETIPALQGSNNPDGDQSQVPVPPLDQSQGQGRQPFPLPVPDGDSAAWTAAAGANPTRAGTGAGAGTGGYGLGAGGLGAGGLGAGGFGVADPTADPVYGGRGLGGRSGSRGVAAGARLAGRGAGALAGQGAAAEAAAARGGAAGTRGGAAGTRGGAFCSPGSGAGGRDDDRDKPLAPFLVADGDLFADDRRVAPPVIGA
jgi:hypothetical protein